jgi:hypothetical protein
MRIDGVTLCSWAKKYVHIRNEGDWVLGFYTVEYGAPIVDKEHLVGPGVWTVPIEFRQCCNAGEYSYLSGEIIDEFLAELLDVEDDRERWYLAEMLAVVLFYLL